MAYPASQERLNGLGVLCGGEVRASVIEVRTGLVTQAFLELNASRL